MKVIRYASLLIAVLIAASLSPLPVSAEDVAASGKPRVAVFGFLNLTGDSAFTIPTETATENITFSLRLLNRYETVATDMILRDLSDTRLAQYCALNGLDFILYGTLTRNPDGRQSYELSIFDRKKGRTTVRETAQGESVMDVFDVADRLSVSVLGSIIGRRLSFGSIRLENANKQVEFDAFIDGVAVPSGGGAIDRVPEGSHSVRLVRKGDVPQGARKALDFAVTVKEGETAMVSFAFDTLSPGRGKSESMDMVSVAGGSFDNGTARMTVSSFLIGTYEVTQKQYEDVMGKNPVASSSLYGYGNGYPVYNASWYDAVEFCNALSARDGYDNVYTIDGTNVTADLSKNGYRLPTEAEWEFAARGGNGTHGYKFAGSDKIGHVAWNRENAASTTHTVGTKVANELGLFDMSGNVWEWCHDWYGDYPSGDRTDYSGPPSGKYRVKRGGNFVDLRCMVSQRNSGYPSASNDYNGFRVARVP